MSDYRERIERSEKVARGLRTAATWVRKGGWFAIDDLANEWEVERFLASALDAVEMVVTKRPPKAYFYADGDAWGIGDNIAREFDLPPLRGWTESYDFEQILSTAENIVNVLRAEQRKGRRLGLIEKLESVEGRTPEEAAAHLAKAAELRAEDGLPPRVRA